jgi:hypothetical protein
MSLLNWPAEQRQATERRSHGRMRVAEALITLFGTAFPEISYDLIWQSPTINAQAWRVGSARHVTIYGGLIRCPTMTRSGLALTIAHETGHHLGGPPQDVDMPWMTWQGQADYWAARIAMPFVFESQARNMTLRGARQILRLHEEILPLLDGDEPDISALCRYHIFCAGAVGSEIPACARAEYQRCFSVLYPSL